jgi:hypothetical protein
MVDGQFTPEMSYMGDETGKAVEEKLQLDELKRWRDVELKATIDELQEAIDEISAEEGANLSPATLKLIDVMKRLKAGEDPERVIKEIVPNENSLPLGQTKQE